LFSRTVKSVPNLQVRVSSSFEFPPEDLTDEGVVFRVLVISYSPESRF